MVFLPPFPLVNQTAENIPYSTCLVNHYYISTSDKIKGYGGASPTLPNFCVCRRGISGRLVRSRVACWINAGFITQYALRNTRSE